MKSPCLNVWTFVHSPPPPPPPFPRVSSGQWKGDEGKLGLPGCECDKGSTNEPQKSLEVKNVFHNKYYRGRFDERKWGPAVINSIKQSSKHVTVLSSNILIKVDSSHLIQVTNTAPYTKYRIDSSMQLLFQLATILNDFLNKQNQLNKFSKFK